MPVPRFPFEAVVFDMDGLLLDTERLYRMAMQEAGRELGFPVSAELYGRLIGRGWRDSRRLLVEEFGSEFPVDRFEAVASRAYDDHIRRDGPPVKAGAAELLAWLDGFPVPRAVATSTARRVAVAKLAKADLLHRFRVVVTGDQVERGKPAPDIYLKACAELGAEPGRCVALEDSPPGVASAFAAGLTVLHVPDLVASEEATRARAAAVLEDLIAARAWLSERVAEAGGRA